MNHSGSGSSMEPREDDAVEPAWDDRSGFGDEPSNAVTREGRGGTASGSIAAYGWVALLIAASGVVNVLSAAKDVTLSGGLSLFRPLLLEVTSAIAWIAFSPLPRYGIAQLRSSRNRPTAFAVALVSGLLYALLHLVTTVLLRKLAFGAVAGGYTFHWAVEFPYEFRKDLISTLMIAALFWLIERRTSVATGLPVDAPAANPAESPSAPPRQGLWLRDGPRSFYIDPRDIISVTSAGNYVEFRFSAGLRLIRGTLAAEEARLKDFGLVRVHRTRLANLHHILAIELRPAGDFLLRMDNGDTIAGSRRYRKTAISIKNVPNRPHAVSLDSAPIRQDISHPAPGRGG
jgi:hypothetical protein